MSSVATMRCVFCGRELGRGQLCPYVPQPAYQCPGRGGVAGCEEGRAWYARHTSFSELTRVRTLTPEADALGSRGRLEGIGRGGG